MGEEVRCGGWLEDAGRSVISKISAIVLAVSEGGGRTLTEIATRSDLPLSTVHRLVTELAAWRVLERDSEGALPGRERRWGRSTAAPTRSPSRDPSAPTWVSGSAVPVMEDLFRATGAPVRVGSWTGRPWSTSRRRRRTGPCRGPSRRPGCRRTLPPWVRPCSPSRRRLRSMRSSRTASPGTPPPP